MIHHQPSHAPHLASATMDLSFRYGILISATISVAYISYAGPVSVVTAEQVSAECRGPGVVSSNPILMASAAVSWSSSGLFEYTVIATGNLAGGSN